MRKQTHFKKAVSLALAAAMAVSVCTTALAEGADPDVTEPAASTETVEEPTVETEDETAEAETPTTEDPTDVDENGENSTEDSTPPEEKSEEESQPEQEVVTDTPTTQEATPTTPATVNEVATQEANVAQIGDTGYATLLAAINAVQDGETVKVLADCELSGGKAYIYGGKNVILDLNGNTVAASIPIVVFGKSSLIMRGNGTYKGVTTNVNGIQVQGALDYYDDGNVDPSKAEVSTFTLESGTLIMAASGGSAIALYGNGATANVKGGKVENIYKNGSIDGGFAIAGNGDRQVGKYNYGGTTINISGGEVISDQDCAIYHPQIGTINVTGGTIRGWAGIEIDSGTLNISGGKIESNYNGDGTRKYKIDGDGNYNFGAAIAVVSKGNQGATGYAGHMTINITGGEIVSESYYAIDEYNLSYVQNPAGEESVAYIDSFNISGDVKIGGKNGAILSDNMKNFVSSGYYTHELSKGYLANGKVCKQLTTPVDNTYGYEVTDAVNEEDVKTDGKLPTTDAGTIDESAVSGITKSDVDKAASTTKVSDDSQQAVKDAVQNAATLDGNGIDTDEVKKAAKEALENSTVQVDENTTITIVTEPKLKIVPMAATKNDTVKSMTFDIKLVYDVKATTAATVDKMDTSNTVTMATDLPVSNPPKMDITIGTLGLGLTMDDYNNNNIYIMHKSKGKLVAYHSIKSVVSNGADIAAVTFTNDKGFSEFTLLCDTRKATVVIDGKTATLTPADIGSTLVHADKDGYTWNNVQFEGIDGTYTTLTDELLTVLAGKNGQVKGTSNYTKNPETATTTPAATATPAPTAAPDTNLYYTCVACGYHDWTATEEGYKCNHCGHLESVKQLSGYANVKGVYTPKSSTAAAAKAKVTSSAIPQTSDEMPIVPIAIIAIAALLGLGVTAYMKKRG